MSFFLTKISSAALEKLIKSLFLSGGAVLTVAYSPDANDGSGLQLLGNTLPEGE